jgi:3-deoxy-D-manno-octulosonate 8-phosphate phosphatase (KDO 8-P phosphatase)
LVEPRLVAGELLARAREIRFLLTDCDGVLTDTGVYYSSRGEELKRFSIRDGMGVERLQTLAGISTGIVSGENTGSLVRRAQKLKIGEVHLGARDKGAVVDAIVRRLGLAPSRIAYIGDDVNDLCAIERVGLSACPADAYQAVRERVDYVCSNRGGHGAFREFAELLILAVDGHLDSISSSKSSSAERTD